MTEGHSKLNAAIEKLRETAEHATGGPWMTDADDPTIVVSGAVAPYGAPLVTSDLNHDDAAWIALLDPAVGERLIALLERINELAPYWAEPYAAAYVPILEAAVRLATTLSEAK